MKSIQRRRRCLIGFLIAGFLYFSGITPGSAWAASLFFLPSAQTVSVGQIFTVNIQVSSPDQVMNAASGDISFPTDKLRALSVSNANSAMNLWVQNPSFSNTSDVGNVNFAGVVLNPGFIGVQGNVITIKFEAVATGDAALSFSDGSVLANDGNGTNILESLGKTDVTITPAAAQPGPSPLPVTPSQLPEQPASSTFPASVIEVPPVVPSTTLTNHPVTVNGWFVDAGGFLIVWVLAILLILLLIIAIIVSFDYLVNRRHRSPISEMREIIRQRRELRDDLQRISRDFDADHSEEVDLSAAGIRKKKAVLQKEIEHLERDIDSDRGKDG